MEHNRLLRTIEEQNRKLENYQKKLRDVVQAYKDLSKEKAALEATVGALNQSLEKTSSEKAGGNEGALKGTSDPNNVSQDSQGEDTESNASTTFGDDEQGNQSCEQKQGNHSSELMPEDPSKQQLATLTSSLVTVTQQKSKLEAIYLAEKKKLRQDAEEKERNFQEERDNLLKQIQSLENDLEQWRAKVRGQQHEHEKEQNNQGMMLRELQQLLTTERIGKVSLETQVEDFRLQIAEGERLLQQKSGWYEKVIGDLRNDVDSLQKQLKASRESSNEPSSLLMRLQKELLDLKEHEKRVVQQEQQRANDAETRLSEISGQNEERLAALEAKVSEFSETLGAAERMRSQDQQTIQKLRERILQLDLENTALASASSAPSADSALGDNDLDLPTITEKMLKLKEQFKSACDQLDRPMNLYEALQMEQDLASHEDVHRRCHELYDQLREEFERYKLRAQSVLKNKNSRDLGPEQEIATLKTQLGDFREKYVNLRQNFEDQERKVKEREDYFAKALTTMTENHRSETLQKETDHRQKTEELNTEIRRHRERTVSLLAEKDREIAALRLQVSPRLSDVEVGRAAFQPLLVPSSPEPDASEVGASSEEASAVAQLLRQNPHHSGGGGDPKLLHFAQEQGRKEVEISTLRRQKHGLEMALREQQQTFQMRLQDDDDRIQALQELVKKHERDKSRENANLEYLKNVIYHYLISTDNSGRQPMLNAITTILEFSPKEKQQVNLAMSRGWWTYKHSSSK